jgi:hypothetical protein
MTKKSKNGGEEELSVVLKLIWVGLEMLFFIIPQFLTYALLISFGIYWAGGSLLAFGIVFPAWVLSKPPDKLTQSIVRSVLWGSVFAFLVLGPVMFVGWAFNRMWD